MQSATISPIASRFVWKEYRTLRGLWLAVLVLGVLVQWTSYAFHFGPTTIDWATIFFSIALGAAALYAVGVAATTFAMEHEEETYGYIACLPTRWLPVFAGKLLFAAASAIALAAALSLIGWVLCGFDTPGGRDAPRALGIFGFAIVEALAWGTFFSLLLRQPLLAALLAIGAESLALTWATNTFAEGTLPALSPHSYLAVLPVRVAITVCIALIDVLLARRWLVTDSRTTAGLSSSAAQGSPTSTAIRPWSRLAARVQTVASKYVSVPVLSHLLWQAWRQSWRLMLAMPAIAAFFCCSLYLITNYSGTIDPYDENKLALTLFVIALVATALYASAVFSTDQRGNKYRFLSEHAVWPRYVWLSRLLVWLLPVVLAVVIAATLLVGGANNLLRHLTEQFQWRVQNSYWWEARHALEQWRGIAALMRALFFALWGILVGFALGQACSLCFRRAIIAGFAAAVFAVPFLMWGIVIWTWELPPVVFLLPLVLGLLAATWLRVPDWIVDRNSLRAWLKVAAVVLLPILFVGTLVPKVRLIPVTANPWAIQQLRYSLGVNLPPGSTDEPAVDAASVVATWVANYKAQTSPQASATADRLIRLAEMIVDWPGPNRTSLTSNTASMSRDLVLRKYVDKNRAVIDETMTLVEEDYRFPPIFVARSTLSGRTYDRVTGLVGLLGSAAFVETHDGDLAAALKYHLAALRLWEGVWHAQPSYGSLPGWNRQLLQSQLVDWAVEKGQTSAQIKQAISALDNIYAEINEPRPDVESLRDPSPWTPPETLMVNYLILSDIVRGAIPPTFLTVHAGPTEYVAFLTGQFSFERQRAVRVLDFLFVDETAQWRDVAWRLGQQRLQRWAKETEKTRGEGAVGDMGRDLRERISRAYSLSYGIYGESPVDARFPPYSWLRTTNVLRLELASMEPFGRILLQFADTQVSAWGLRQQLALVAYRLDHGAYPDSLVALVPDYLPFVPIDAYSGRPYEYRSRGLPLEFRGTYYADNIEPHTPLLWSVGPRDAQLRLETVIDAVDPEEDPSQELTDVRHEYYVLDESMRQWHYGDQLVFPLPK